MSHYFLPDTSERDHNEEQHEQELSASSHGKCFSGHVRGPHSPARAAFLFLKRPLAHRWPSVAGGRWTSMGLEPGPQSNPKLSARATPRRKPPLRSDPTWGKHRQITAGKGRPQWVGSWRPQEH